ncbi:CAP domain-containing protein [Maribacter antarcticus]|uniref:CAP domain-containing protein n=1 Tax=Maribacter antarcticus TaxID=505250 RepID=UPI001FE0E0A4|nr:CAP domain-containing protein [Maribacter antarcticus]
MRSQHAVFVLFVFIFGSCSTEPTDDTPNITATNVVGLEQEVLDIVNSHRSALETNTLIFSAIAYEYANTHTDYMINKGSLSHDNFSSRASSIASKVEVQMVAENVAKDYSTAQDAFIGWYESTNHKKTMEGDFTHTAVSVKEDEDGNFYYTQLFYKE